MSVSRPYLLKMRKLRVAVLVSGGGTNLQALLDAEARGELNRVEFCLVLSSRADAYALERAKARGIPTSVVRRKDYESPETFESGLISELEKVKAEFIVLAGFLAKVGERILSLWHNRIINIHPSLLPAYGGQGMYGLRVHEAVLAAGESWSGATVHLVNQDYDQGRILKQKRVRVMPDDTPESLQQRIMREAEWQIYPETLGELAEQIMGEDK